METIKKIQGQIVCEEGAAFNNIYFIKTGEFKVTKRVKMPNILFDGVEPV